MGAVADSRFGAPSQCGRRGQAPEAVRPGLKAPAGWAAEHSISSGRGRGSPPPATGFLVLVHNSMPTPTLRHSVALGFQATATPLRHLRRCLDASQWPAAAIRHPQAATARGIAELRHRRRLVAPGPGLSLQAQSALQATWWQPWPPLRGRNRLLPNRGFSTGSTLPFCGHRQPEPRRLSSGATCSGLDGRTPPPPAWLARIAWWSSHPCSTPAGKQRHSGGEVVRRPCCLARSTRLSNSKEPLTVVRAVRSCWLGDQVNRRVDCCVSRFQKKTEAGRASTSSTGSAGRIASWRK